MENNWAVQALLSGAGDGPGLPRGSLVSWVGSSMWDWGLKGWKHPCYHGEPDGPSPPRAGMGTFSKPQVTEICSHLCPTVW